MRPLSVFPSAGVNLFSAAETLAEGECRSTKNLVPAPQGKMSKRGGLARPFTTLAPTDINLPANAVLSPISQGVYDVVVFMRSSVASASIVGSSLSGDPLSFAASVPFDHPRPAMLAWKNGVYTLPGPYAEWTAGPSRYPFYVFDTTAETSAVLSTLAFAGSGNENIYPSIAVPYKQRLVLMNFGKGFENTIAFTDNFTADVVGDGLLSVTGRAISLVAAGDGDEIVAGIEVMLTNVGSPAESGLLILRKHGTPFLLTGDMDQTTGGTSTLDIKRISIETGCAGMHTVVRTPMGIIWAGADDVWAFAAGVLPTRIGQKIQPALKITPTQLQFRWSAAYLDGFYRLAIWGEGQGMAITDAPGDQWWLDLRDGLPQDWRQARWFGPQQFLGGATDGVAPRPQTWNIIRETRANKQPRLYYLDRVEIAASTYGAALGEYGEDPRDLTATAAYIPDDAYVDPEILSELVTGEIVLAAGREQFNDGLEMVVRPDSDIYLTADVVMDDGYKTSSKSKAVSSQGFRAGSSPTDDSTEVLHNKSTRLTLHPPSRRPAQQHRFHLRDNAGYVIASWNKYIVAQTRTSLDALSNQWVVTMTEGVYSLSELISHLNTLFTTPTFGTAWTWSQDAVTGFIKVQRAQDGTNRIGIGLSVQAPGSGTTPTAGQAAASLRFVSLLGMDTSNADRVLSGAPSGGQVTINGRIRLFQKAISNFELYGLQANMEVLPRRP